MKKEIFTIKIETECKKQCDPHYLSSTRKFTIQTSRAMLFRSLEAMENKLVRLYAVSTAEIVEVNPEKK